MLNAITLAQNLIKRPSVTPNDEGCLDYIEHLILTMGGTCERFDKQGTSNLLVKIGSGSPVFCFAGHTDVVPPGISDGWDFDPFDPVIHNNKLYGRGVSDMKGAIAAFLYALDCFINSKKTFGTIYLALTSDEEGPALHGTQYIVEILKTRHIEFDMCLVGEPTNPSYLGEMVKIGRRGSLNGTLTVYGKQGHVAYPDDAKNAIPVMLSLCNFLQNITLDKGFEAFDPSHLEFTSIDVNNPTTNIIPGTATCSFNIRFNPSFTKDSLINFLQESLKKEAKRLKIDELWQVTFSGNAQPFLCKSIKNQNIVTQAIHHVTGKTPIISTSGGTSDARFLKDLGPTIEFGLHSNQAHQVNENIPLDDITELSKIYEKILQLFFAS